MNIFKIEREYRELAEQIIEAGGEVDEQTEQALAINKDSLQLKAVQYAMVIKDNDNTVDAIDKEIKRLTALKTAVTNTNERLKDTVHKAMDLYEITEIKGSNFKISFRESKSLEILDESVVPEKWKVSKTVTTVTIPKAPITAAWKAGEVVPGTNLATNKNLQIK